jgi:hypothetical protein
MYKRANAGHIACSLSFIDLMIASLILEKTEGEQFILSKDNYRAAWRLKLLEIIFLFYLKKVQFLFIKG